MQSLCQQSWNTFQKCEMNESLTKMNLQRETDFTEFEHSTLTLKVQRLCMVQPSYCQEFYLTVRFYKFAIVARS